MRVQNFASGSFKWAMISFLALALPACGDSSGPRACKDNLKGVTQLFVVLADAMDAPRAEIIVLHRKNAKDTSAWHHLTGPFQAALGEAGIGWGAGFERFKRGSESIKQEGDKRTPAGIFLIGPSFGFEPAAWPDHIDLKAKRPVCVDDLASPHYGAIVSKDIAGEATSAEDMANISVYKRGIVVAYPRDRIEKSGSCIFFHIWKAKGEGTAGCIASAEGTVAVLQGLKSRAKTAVVIWPRTAVTQLETCLPDVQPLLMSSAASAS